MPETSAAVLFVCTGNAGRSQIAQALLRCHAGDRIRVESAGVAPWNHLHPMAERVLREQGISAVGQFPKPVSAVADQPFDVVVTLGDPAHQRLPPDICSCARWVHWDLPDPADADGTPRSREAFLAALQAIAARLPRLRDMLAGLTGPHIRAAAEAPGASTSVFWPGAFVPSEHLPLIRKTGFAAFEVDAYLGERHFDWQDQEAVRRLKTVADDQGIVVWSFHAPDTGSVSAADPAGRMRQEDALRRSIAVAEQLGAKVVVSHAMILVGEGVSVDDHERRVTDFLERMRGEAEASPVTLAFENDSSPAGSTSADHILASLSRRSRSAYGFALDTGHSNIAGDLAAIAAGVNDRLSTLHLNDNDGREDLHRVPGEGTVDWQAVSALLRSAQYAGPRMYEILGRDRPAGDLLARIREADDRFQDGTLSASVALQGPAASGHPSQPGPGQESCGAHTDLCRSPARRGR